jgi:hypothetical protein
MDAEVNSFSPTTASRKLTRCKLDLMSVQEGM